MNAIDIYARRYKRDPLNNFAVACLNDNSRDELEDALTLDNAEAVDVREWGLAGEKEWRDAIEATLEEMKRRD